MADVGSLPDFAFSLRAAERYYHIDRQRLSDAIYAGELPAMRLGRRRILVLRGDLEGWLQRFAIRPRVPPSPEDPGLPA